MRLRDFGTEESLARTVWRWLGDTLRRPSPVNILVTLFAGLVLLVVVLASGLDLLVTLFDGAGF